jgi:hypothetical protein
MSLKERLRTNPGIWGLVFGGALLLIAMFFPLYRLTGSAGATNVIGRATITGTTIVFVGLLLMICGGGVAGSGGGGRIWWALLALVFALVSLWAMFECAFNTDYAAIRIADSTAYQTSMGGNVTTGISDAYRAAINAGNLSTQARLGAYLGLIGAALATIGAVYSLFRKPRKVMPDL